MSILSTVIYQQILTGKVRFTRSYDKAAKSLTKKLLTADLTKRYGCLKQGASDIKQSKFFVDMDWEALLQRKLDAPIKPELSSNTDTSNFEEYPDDSKHSLALLLAALLLCIFLTLSSFPLAVDDAVPPEYEGQEDPFLSF